MRQHMLNGWLVAALVAVICLLGTTAYTEIRKELPSVACKHERTVGDQRDCPADCKGRDMRRDVLQQPCAEGLRACSAEDACLPQSR